MANYNLTQTGEEVQRILNSVQTIDASVIPGSSHPLTGGAVFTALSNTVAESGVYDVTVNNNNAKFASLSALLNSENLDTLIPIARRKGGMSIKFVHTYDNKYVEYFLTKNTWSASEADWEKVNLEEEVSQLGQDIISSQVQVGNLENCVLIGFYYNTNGTKGAADNYRCLSQIINVSKDIYYNLNGGNYLTARCFDETGQYLGDSTRDTTNKKLVLRSGTKKVGIYWKIGGTTPDDYSKDYLIFDNLFVTILSLDSAIAQKVDFLSLNKFNPDATDNEIGYLERGGSVTYYASYITSGFFPVIEGQTVYAAKDGTKGFRVILFFDSSKTAIETSYAQEVYSAVAPSGAAYFRVTHYVNNEKKQIAFVDANYSPLNPITQWMYDAMGDFTINPVEPYLPTIERAEFLLEELFPVKQFFVDNEYFAVTTGAIVTNTPTYARTDYIPVKHLKYKYTGFYYSGFYCFDSSKNFLGQGSRLDNVVTLLPNTAFVGLNFQKAVQPSGYETNGVFYNLEPYVDLEQAINEANPLYGKKWCVVGDSFSEWSPEQYTSGRFANKYKTYKFMIALRNGMEIYDMTLSGRTMAYPNDHTFDNAFAKPSLYQSIPADADYITIMLGINDVAHLAGYSPDGESTQGYITLGTIDSVDTGSFYGAWNVVMQWIFENRPLAHVGIIITNGLGGNGPAGTSSEYGQQIYQALKDIVERWNVPFINLNGGDGKTPMMQRGIYPEGTPASLIAAKWNAFATNPTEPYNGHTNVNGHKYESYAIEQFLRGL